MEAIASFIGGILGKFTGIYCLSIFLNFLLKKITKSDNVKQRIIATAVSVIIFIIIPTWVTRTTTDFNALIGWNVIAIVCWLIINSFFVLKFRFKDFFITLLVGCVFWFIGSLLIGLLLVIFEITLNNNLDNLAGVIILGISFIVSSVIIYKKKLKA